MPAALALALEVEVPADVELAEGVVQAIGEKELLLCLDNLEQVLEAATFVAELVARCPRLHVLATSRASLGLAGEREYPLEPLAEDEALQLFAERAQAVAPDFSVVGQEETIRAICDRLDRLPLALELAAGRVRLFSAEALLTRLEHTLPLLTGGPRDRPERQQTLRAAIDWSYRLLEPDEQRLFAALSVFVGSFDLEAAVAVSGQDELELLDPLTDLIVHSLVRRPGARRRASLLPPRDDPRVRGGAARCVGRGRRGAQPSCRVLPRVGRAGLRVVRQQRRRRVAVQRLA